MTETRLTPGSIATLACCLEVAAPKPGNVHRGADFENLFLEDFLVSATILGQTIDGSAQESVGKTIRSVVENTQSLVGTNTNLGMALLMVPLAKAIQWNPQGEKGPVARGQLAEVLHHLGADEGELIYQAIHLANPGALGEAERADVREGFPSDLSVIEVMYLAKDRDLIARQYINHFQDVFDSAIDYLLEGRVRFGRLNQAIVFAHLAMMAEFPDSLIARKCGLAEAARAQGLAREALRGLRQAADPAQQNDWSQVTDFDFWLRAKGNQRNPGTTADMIAAALFVAIQNRLILPPYR